MDNNSFQQDPSPVPEDSGNQRQENPSEFSAPDTLASPKKLPNKKIIILLTIFFISIVTVICVYFIIQVANKKETARVATTSPTVIPGPDNTNNLNLNKYDGRFNFFYPKSWYLSPDQTTEEGLESVVLANYPLLEENSSSTQDTSELNTVSRLKIKLEFQYLEIPELSGLTEELSDDLNIQGKNYEDLNIANFKTTNFYGSNEDGEFFVAYTAGPNLQRTLTIFVYYQGLIPSEITQSEIDNIQRTTEWKELKNIFSSISFN